LIKQIGNSALYVTHDQTEALAIADRVLLLDKGQIQQEGPPEQIYGEPTSRFSAEFIGSNNCFEGKIVEVSGRRARLAGDGWTLWGTLKVEKNRDTIGTGLVRVESVRLADGAGDHRLKMHLKSALYLGERWEYVLELGDLRLRTWGETSRPAGEYWVSIPPDTLWIF
jgi:iron(III) transport system ATP-binding protein